MEKKVLFFINQADAMRKSGYLDDALKLYNTAEKICRKLGDGNGICITLVNQANILETHGVFDRAMALNKEAESICREIGNMVGLNITLSNQAFIMEKRGDLAGAMPLYKEQERICRELGKIDGLVGSLIYQAVVLELEYNQVKDALSLLDEAYQLAVDQGDVSLIKQVEEIRSEIVKRKG